MKPEASLRQQVAEYLQLQYPDVVYRFDLAADLPLTVGQASRHKRLHPHRGYPDLFIAQTAEIAGTIYSGMYLELKAEGKSPFKKNGTLRKSEHLEEQDKMLAKLTEAGYYAGFGVGFEECKSLIDSYLKDYRKSQAKLDSF